MQGKWHHTYISSLDHVNSGAQENWKEDNLAKGSVETVRPEDTGQGCMALFLLQMFRGGLLGT